MALVIMSSCVLRLAKFKGKGKKRNGRGKKTKTNRGEQEEREKENEAERARKREGTRYSARITGEAAPRGQNNFPHKYTRVSLIITGKRPA
jgi:hypothetical protein